MAQILMWTNFWGLLRTYLRNITGYVPMNHWAFMSIFSMALIMYYYFLKKHTPYCSVVLGMTVFISLFMLDTMVVNRYGVNLQRSTGFDIIAEYNRLLYGDETQHMQMLFNIIAFIPLGFFLTEFISSTIRISFSQRMEYVVICAFVLSLCIESLQLTFNLGLFEITDLLMNSLGAFLGAGLSVLGRMVLKIEK